MAYLTLSAKMSIVISFVVISLFFCVNCQMGKKLIDVPSGCPSGELRAHDGNCIEPFKLKINLTVPNVTATTASSVVHNSTLFFSNWKVQKKPSTTQRTTVRPIHKIPRKNTTVPVNTNQHK